MTFSFRPAVRERTSLLISLAGPSGCGKTFSALELATGLAGEGGRIAFIDTEAGRALHYADRFRFDHGDMRPPFRPEAYKEAIVAADDAGYDVVIIDSMSHEYDGDGGLIDWAASLEGSVKSPGNWKEPKIAHKRMMSRLLQMRCHLIFCLRAEEKMLLQTEVDPQSGRKKTIVVPASDRPLLERWAPACEKRFAYEMTASFLMLPDRPGVPLPLKLQEQHRDAFPADMQIGRGAGSALAAWAAGGAVTQRSAADEALREATDAAEKGREAFLAWWNGPGKRKRDMLRPHLSELQETALAADARAEEVDDPFNDDESRLENDAQPPSRPLMTQVYNADGEALEGTVSTVADFLARVGRMIAGTDDKAESQAIIRANEPAWRDIWSGSADAGQTFLWKSYGGRP